MSIFITLFLSQTRVDKTCADTGFLIPGRMITTASHDSAWPLPNATSSPSKPLPSKSLNPPV